jgi:carbamoyltransferase
MINDFYVLGINFSHDSSMVLLKNGELIAAIEEEKVSRVKQDFGWPRHAIDRVFLEKKIERKLINYIVFDKEIPRSLGKNEIGYRFSKSSFRKNKEYIDRITSYLGLTSKKMGSENENEILKWIKAEGFTNAKVKFYDHHLSHAASAYYAAPISTDLVITSDGRGGDSAFNFYRPTKNGLERIRHNDYTTSVGAFYSMITKLLGFRPTRHEGKITGLAAYGKPTRLVNEFKNLWKYVNGKLTRFPFDKIDEKWSEYKLNAKLSRIELINLSHSSDIIASDYAKRSRILLAWLQDVTKGYSKEDIAYACQKTAEDITLDEINRVKEEFFPNKKISVALAGGVFANVRINQFIYELPYIDNIFVQPAMGDSGLALGNAILLDIEERSGEYLSRQYAFENTYLGPDYSNDLKKFVSSFSSRRFQMQKMNNPSQTVARLLKENKIIGFWSGKMEWGPRALGSRSIILNTFDKSVNDTLNERLNRTEFMPFAPVVIDEIADTYFPNYKSEVPAADYMTVTYNTDPEYHEILQATVHVDGSARPQVIRRNENALYYDIIKDFYKITGCGALVNTSFNAHEEPIVSSPEVAFRALETGRVDCLVMDDYLFQPN